MARGIGKFGNPFYVLLVIAGTLFCITACAYGVMTVIESTPADMVRDAGEGTTFATAPRTSSLILWMKRYGAAAMAVQLAVLGLATAAAMITDDFWLRARPRRAQQAPQKAAQRNSP